MKKHNKLSYFKLKYNIRFLVNHIKFFINISIKLTIYNFFFSEYKIQVVNALILHLF